MMSKNYIILFLSVMSISLASSGVGPHELTKAYAQKLGWNFLTPGAARHMDIVNNWTNKWKSVSEKPKVTILIGPPAAGKGIVEKKIKEKYPQFYFGEQTLDIDAIRKETPEYINWFKDSSCEKMKQNIGEAARASQDVACRIENEIIVKLVSQKKSFLWETSARNEKWFIEKVFPFFHQFGYGMTILYVKTEPSKQHDNVCKRNNDEMKEIYGRTTLPEFAITAYVDCAKAVSAYLNQNNSPHEFDNILYFDNVGKDMKVLELAEEIIKKLKEDVIDVTKNGKKYIEQYGKNDCKYTMSCRLEERDIDEEEYREL